MSGLGSALRLTSPSAGPSAARIDHLNRQIADLVAQNKDALSRVATLERAVQAERERGEQGMKDVEEKWKAERAEWLDTVDLIQGAHEIVHLRTRDELHATRIAVLFEQDRVQKERTRTARKELNLTASQGRERDLERDLALVTYELEVAREEIEYERAEASLAETQKLQVATAKCTKLEEQKKLKIEELAIASKERDKLERELDKLKTTNASLVADVESAKNKMDRVTLKLDGAQNLHAELERKNNELKLSNKDLKQQLDKWQNLETKGGAEVEQLKKEKLDLQARLKDSEALVKDAEKKEKEHTRALQKETKKVANLIVEREQLQDLLQQTQQELESARRLTAKHARSPTVEVHSDDDAPAPQVTKPKKRRRSPPQEIDGSDEEVQELPIEKSKKRRRVDDAQGLDEENKPLPKREATRSAKSSNNSDDERVPKARAKAKAKTSSRTSEEPERAAKPRREKPSSSGTSARDKPSSSGKTSSTGGKTAARPSKLAKETIQEEPSVDEAQPVNEPAKKRKIFLPSTQATSFEFNMPQQDNALNIPTSLSPIKQPAREPSKSLLGRFWG